MTKCEACGGKGFFVREYWVEMPLYHSVVHFEECDKCHGTGKIKTRFDLITESESRLASFLADYTRIIIHTLGNGNFNGDLTQAMAWVVWLLQSAENERRNENEMPCV